MLKIDYYKFIEMFSKENNIKILEKDRKKFYTKKINTTINKHNDDTEQKPTYYSVGVMPKVLSYSDKKPYIEKELIFNDLAKDLKGLDDFEIVVSLENIIDKLKEKHSDIYMIYTDELSIIFGIVLMLYLNTDDSQKEFRNFIIEKIAKSSFLYYTSFDYSDPEELYNYLVNLFKLDKIDYKKILKIPQESKITKNNYKPSEYVHHSSELGLANWDLTKIQFDNIPHLDQIHDLLDKLFKDVNYPPIIDTSVTTQEDIKKVMDMLLFCPIIAQGCKRVLINFAQRSFKEYVDNLYNLWQNGLKNNFYTLLIPYFRYNALYLVFSREGKKEFKFNEKPYFLIDSPIIYMVERYGSKYTYQ